MYVHCNAHNMILPYKMLFQKLTYAEMQSKPRQSKSWSIQSESNQRNWPGLTLSVSLQVGTICPRFSPCSQCSVPFLFGQLTNHSSFSRSWVECHFQEQGNLLRAPYSDYLTIIIRAAPVAKRVECVLLMLSPYRSDLSLIAAHDPQPLSLWRGYLSLWRGYLSLQRGYIPLSSRSWLPWLIGAGGATLRDLFRKMCILLFFNSSLTLYSSHSQARMSRLHLSVGNKRD